MFIKGMNRVTFHLVVHLSLLFFGKDRIVLAKDLTAASRKGMELYAKMGEVLGARP